MPGRLDRSSIVADADGTNLQVSVEKRGENLIMSPTGDIDLTASSTFRAELKKGLEQKPARLVVDLANVPYMDSSGVATLVEAMQLARRGKIKLVLCGLGERVRSIFEIAKLDMVFLIVAGVDEALAA
jgi:anti-sigma B factor antagonist